MFEGELMNTLRTALTLALACTAAFGADKPNVVIMISDDVGWGDLGSYMGGGVRGAPTPNLDRMAAEGLRLSSFYAQPFCTPTRASLITGRLPVRAGFAFPLFPGLPMGLVPDEITIAELLEPAGYHSAVIGKWHLGDLEVHLPHRQGFDEFWGFLYHCDAYLYPEDRDWRLDTLVGRTMRIRGIVEGKKGSMARDVEPIDAKRLETLDRDIATRAVDYIQTHAEDENPFFLLVGFAKAHYKNFVHPDFRGKSGSGDYGDALMELDYHSGMVLDAVRDAGIAEDTLVVWFSDNGPSYDTFPDCGYTPFRGGKGQTYEGGVRMPCLAWWPGKIQPGRTSDGIMTTMDLFTTVASLAGVDVPKDRPIDGHDQTAFLLGNGPSATDTVYYYVGDRLMAIRNGKWKAHFATIDSIPDGPVNEFATPKLYDLSVDPGETTNLVYTKTWEAVHANMLMRRHLAEMQRFPNRQLIPAQ
jgi:arylsulfatase